MNEFTFELMPEDASGDDMIESRSDAIIETLTEFRYDDQLRILKRVIENLSPDGLKYIPSDEWLSNEWGDQS